VTAAADFIGLADVVASHYRLPLARVRTHHAVSVNLS